MRLNLHKSIFFDHNDLELFQIMTEAYKKRISVHIDDNDSYKAWIADRTRSEQTKWDYIIRTSASLHMSANTTCVFEINGDVKVSNWNAQTPIATLQDVDYLLKLPVIIALENGRNDRNFLLSICKPNLRKRLLELESQNSLVFDGAGGINELINYMKGRYIIHPANKYKYWLLFDGDAPSPKNLAASAIELIGLCKDRGFINHHCLNRRAIENYLPISEDIDFNMLYPLFKVDKTNAKNNELFKDQLKAFGKLSEKQRHHYHMKDGLSNNSCKNSGLYESFDAPTKKLLNKGFKFRIDSIYDFGADASFDDFETLYKILLKDGATKELAPLLNQLDFNTRKTK